MDFIKHFKSRSISENPSTEEIVNYWASYGLLYGVVPNLQITIANLLHSCAIRISEGDVIGVTEEFQTVIFPIIRRVIGDINEDEFGILSRKKNFEEIKNLIFTKISSDEILENALYLYHHLLPIYNKTYGEFHKFIDIEAECVAQISKMVSHKLTIKYSR